MTPCCASRRSPAPDPSRTRLSRGQASPKVLRGSSVDRGEVAVLDPGLRDVARPGMRLGRTDGRAFARDAPAQQRRCAVETHEIDGPAARAFELGLQVEL